MNTMIKKSKIPVKKIIKSELIDPLKEQGYDFSDNEKVSYDNFLYKVGHKGIVSQISIQYHKGLSYPFVSSQFSIGASSNILCADRVYFYGKTKTLDEIRTEDDLIFWCRKYRDYLVDEIIPLIDKYQRELFQISPELELDLYENFEAYLKKYRASFSQKAKNLEELSEQFKVLFENIRELLDDEKSEIVCMAGAAYASYIKDRIDGENSYSFTSTIPSFRVKEKIENGKSYNVMKPIFSIYYLDDYESLYTNVQSWIIINGNVRVEKTEVVFPRKFE